MEPCIWGHLGDRSLWLLKKYPGFRYIRMVHRIRVAGVWNFACVDVCIDFWKGI
jgi:hypothetical protein